MAFQKGNKFGRGGKQNPSGGRPTKEEQAAKAEMRRAALDALTAGMTKAVETLLLHLSSKNENISVRACESVLEYALRSIECEEIERRLDAIEARLDEGGH